MTNLNWASIHKTVAESLGIVRRGFPLLFIAFAVDAAFIFIFLIALQSYLPESLHKSEAIAGVALASFGAAKLLTQIASGLLSDRLGAKRAIILGTGLLLLADASILPLAHGAPWLIVGSAAIEGFGSSVVWPALYSAGDARFADGEKSRFAALLMLATGGALMVGIGGGTYLNSVATFNAAMIAPIVAVGAAFALALVVSARGASQERDGFELPTLIEMREIITKPQRIAFTALVLVEAAALGALTAVFRAYGRDVLGVTLAHQALLLLPAAIIGGLIVIPGGAIADRLGPKRVLLPGFALTGICLLVLARWSDPIVVAPTAAVAGLGFGSSVPAIASTMMSLAGSTSRRGGVIGWFMTMDGVGHAAGPAAAGVLLALWGAESVLVAAGALFLIGAYLVGTSSIGEREVQLVAVDTRARNAEPIPGGRS